MSREITDADRTIIQHMGRAYLDLRLLKELEALVRRHRERLEDIWASRATQDDDIRYVADIDTRVRRAVGALTTEFLDVSPEAELVAHVDAAVDEAVTLAVDCTGDLEQALIADEVPVTSLAVAELALKIASIGPTKDALGVSDKILEGGAFGLFAEWVEAKWKRWNGGRPEKDAEAEKRPLLLRSLALQAVNLPWAPITARRTAAARKPALIP